MDTSMQQLHNGETLIYRHSKQNDEGTIPRGWERVQIATLDDLSESRVREIAAENGVPAGVFNHGWYRDRGKVVNNYSVTLLHFDEDTKHG